jgi:hypothetical protein
MKQGCWLPVTVTSTRSTWFFTISTVIYLLVAAMCLGSPLVHSPWECWQMFLAPIVRGLLISEWTWLQLTLLGGRQCTHCSAEFSWSQKHSQQVLAEQTDCFCSCLSRLPPLHSLSVFSLSISFFLLLNPLWEPPAWVIFGRCPLLCNGLISIPW